MTWRPDPLDIILLVGFALAVYGVWLIFEPAAFITAGISLVVASVRAGQTRERRREPNDTTRG